MHSTWLNRIPLFVALSLSAIAAACTSVGAPTGQTGTSSATAVGNVCPTATAETRLLVNKDHGYCLLYPSAYTVEHYSPTGTAVVMGSIMNHTDPRVSVETAPSEGRTTQQAGDALYAQVGSPGIEVKRSGVRIGGQEAVLLDNVPYQDLTREIILAHNDKIYRLQFTPADPADAGVYGRTQQLYDTVVGSFHFTQE
ncbi:MAG: hypothetical protein U0822_23590 [Anaerolineae bacterium]